MAKQTVTKVRTKPRTGIGQALERARAQQAATAKSPQAALSRRGRLRRFLHEVKVEMQKVTWPSRADVAQATSVVIVAVVIASVYIGVLDFIWSSIVKLVRLG